MFDHTPQNHAPSRPTDQDTNDPSSLALDTLSGLNRSACFTAMTLSSLRRNNSPEHPMPEHFLDARLIEPAHRKISQYLAEHNKIHLIRPIGSGGFSDVYVGWDEKLDKLVAIKTFKQRDEDLGCSAVNFASWQYHLAMELSHPHMPKVHLVGVSDSKSYLVMDLISSDNSLTPNALIKPALTLENHQGIKQRSYQSYEHSEQNLFDALQLFLGICKQVAFLHSRGVQHCDLKPSNLLITAEPPSWRAKLIDLDSCQIDPSSKLIDTVGPNPIKSPISSSIHAAPETFAISFPTSGASIDIYSLGDVLYCVLCGKSPWKNYTSGLDSLKAAKRDPFSLPKLMVDLPGDKNALQRICHRALHPDRDKRYPSVAELMKDVEGYIKTHLAHLIKE